MRNLLLTALLVVGLGGTAAIPVAASDQARSGIADPVRRGA